MPLFSKYPDTSINSYFCKMSLPGVLDECPFIISIPSLLEIQLVVSNSIWCNSIFEYLLLNMGGWIIILVPFLFWLHFLISRLYLVNMTYWTSQRTTQFKDITPRRSIFIQTSPTFSDWGMMGSLNPNRLTMWHYCCLIDMWVSELTLQEGGAFKYLSKYLWQCLPYSFGGLKWQECQFQKPLLVGLIAK